MGTDDIFHKRKARQNKDSNRKKASIEPYERVLIVCEGEKTEPYYFEEIKYVLEISSANIGIDGSCGSSPKSIVKHAISLFKNEQDSGGFYDRVYCVFDRDTHESYDQAINIVMEINKPLKKETGKQIFYTTRSVPSFEYWFLLHFSTSTKPYIGTIRKSAGDQVIDDLKQFMPEYKKTKKGIYKQSTKDGTLDHAKAHSKRIFDSAERTGYSNPSTNMHEIVEYLQGIKKTND